MQKYVKPSTHFSDTALCRLQGAGVIHTQYRGTRYQVPGTRYQVPGTRYQIPDTRYQVPGTRYKRGTQGALRITFLYRDSE